MQILLTGWRVFARLHPPLRIEVCKNCVLIIVDVALKVTLQLLTRERCIGLASHCTSLPCLMKVDQVGGG